MQNVIVLPIEKNSTKLYKSKKFIIGCVMMVLMAGMIGFTAWGKFLAKGNVSVDAISDRGQEFLTQQAQQGDSIWNQVELTSNSSSKIELGLAEQETTCFTVIVPFEITRVQKSENDQGFLCRLEVQVMSPRSNLVVTAKKKDSTSEDSGLMLRQNDPEVYKKIDLPIKTKKKYQAFMSEDSISVFFQEKNASLTVAFSNVTQLNLLEFEAVAQLIDSIEVKNEL